MIALCKNEIDIIDSFAVQALELFDRIIVFDHSSSDKTAEYLAYVSMQYPKVELFALKMPGYYQSELMTWAIKALVPPSDNGWIFLLDADEFLPFSSQADLRTALASFSSYPIISMRWMNVAPTSFEDRALETTVFRGPPTTSTIVKAAFQPRLLRRYSYAIAQGNHCIIDTTRNSKIYAKPAFALVHIPLRSRAQARNKLEGHLQTDEATTDETQHAALATHYAPLRTLAREHNYSSDVLEYIAAHYGDIDTSGVDKYVPEVSRKGAGAVDVPFVTAKALWCDKYALVRSKVFAETNSQSEFKVIGRHTHLITFDPLAKTFTVTESTG